MENIRTGYIVPSSAAGSDNQLSGCHNLSQVHVFASLLFVCLPFQFCCFVSRGRELELWWRASQRATCSQSVQHSKRGSQETPWPGGFGLYTRHTLLRGDVHRCSTEGEPLPCLLSCSKVCCVASNTSNTSTGILILGMPWGAPWRVQTYSWKTHMPMTAPWALTSGTKINLRFQKKKKKEHQITGVCLTYMAAKPGPCH